MYFVFLLVLLSFPCPLAKAERGVDRKKERSGGGGQGVEIYSDKDPRHLNSRERKRNRFRSDFCQITDARFS